MLKYLFIYRKLILGGCELVIFKWAKELIGKGHQVDLLCNSITKQMYEKYETIGITIHVTSKGFNDAIQQLYVKSDESQEIRVVTFLLDDFLEAYFTKISTSNKKTILYTVHPAALIPEEQNRETRNLVRIFYWKCLKRAIDVYASHKNIICMDRQTISTYSDYFRLNNDIENKKFCIIHIPVDDLGSPENNDDENDDFMVLSVARADFPFKGYLLGLVDYINNNDICDKVRFVIVSTGKDIDELKDRILSLPEEKRKRVKLIEGIEHEKLSELYNESSLYIGMGTTVVEAAMCKTLTIPVAAYTEKLLADHFFHQDPESVTADINCINRFNELFIESISMNIQDREMIKAKSRNLALENYGIETFVDFMGKAFAAMNYDGSYLALREIYKAKNCIRRFRRMLHIKKD